MGTTSNLITEQIKRLPASPGVYLFRDSGGTILYVGKAASLRSRVRSYFRASEKHTQKTQRMVAKINDLDFFVTKTEQEAIILEYNLIQRHQPHYNVRLKDGKTFPFLKISAKTNSYLRGLFPPYTVCVKSSLLTQISRLRVVLVWSIL